MSVPPYALIIKTLKSHSSETNDDTVVVSVPLLRHFLSQCVALAGVDEDSYGRRNPDVAVALRKGETKDLKRHYSSYGYFEGRAGVIPEVDEAWYLKTNPDVAAAVKAGVWESGQHHWDTVGMMEWRSPSRSAEPHWAAWRSLLNRKMIDAAARTSP